MGMWCALDDWQPDLLAEPTCVYLPGSPTPLVWTGSGLRSALLSETLASTWEGAAIAAHWATAHPDQLHAFVGEFEMAYGMARPVQKASPV